MSNWEKEFDAKFIKTHTHENFDEYITDVKTFIAKQRKQLLKEVREKVIGKYKKPKDQVPMFDGVEIPANYPLVVTGKRTKHGGRIGYYSVIKEQLKKLEELEKEVGKNDQKEN